MVSFARAQRLTPEGILYSYFIGIRQAREGEISIVAQLETSVKRLEAAAKRLAVVSAATFALVAVLIAWLLRKRDEGRSD